MELMPCCLDVLAHVAGGDIGVSIFCYARPVVLVPDELQSSCVTEVQPGGCCDVTEGLTPAHHLWVICRSCPHGIAHCQHQCARASLLPHNFEPCHTSSQQAATSVRSLVALCGSADSTSRPIGLLTAVHAGCLGNCQMCPCTPFCSCHHLCNLNMA